jgi:Fur family transcriptional regulator, iron response regulator
MSQRMRALLTKHAIQPSPQRLAVGAVVLVSEAHPTAEDVLAKARKQFPWLSRATVYNTLNLFVRKGLLRAFTLGEGPLVYDPNVEAHHHFIDESSGRIHDVPWEALSVVRVSELPGFKVREYQVVLRGEASKPKK